MTKSSRFRFETLHRVRKLEEKNHKRELGALFLRLEQLIAYRKTIEEGKSSLSVQLASVGQQAEPAAWTTVISDRIKYLNYHRDKSLELEKEVQKRILKKREEVEKALIARKGLDRLQEKHQIRVKERFRKEESKLLDEMIITRPVKGLNHGMFEKEES